MLKLLRAWMAMGVHGDRLVDGVCYAFNLRITTREDRHGAEAQILRLGA